MGGAVGKAKECRECGTEFSAGRGQRFCDPCRASFPQDNRSRILRSTYKLSYTQLAELEAITACEVCGETEDLVIDHNHTTDKVRGKLCRNCNFALGHVKDRPAVLRGLALYLEEKDA